MFLSLLVRRTFAAAVLSCLSAAAAIAQTVDGWSLTYDQPVPPGWPALSRQLITLSDGDVVAYGNQIYRVSPDNGAGAFLPLHGEMSTGRLIGLSGGEMLRMAGSGGCRLQRLAAGGEIRWQTTSGFQCTSAAALPGGEAAVAWRSYQSGEAWLGRISARGSETWRSEVIADVRVVNVIHDAVAPVLYLVVAHGPVTMPPNEVAEVGVYAYNLDGERMWHWQADDEHRGIHGQAAPDGGLLVSAGLPGTAGPEIARLASDGSELMHARITWEGPSLPRYWAPAPGRAFYVGDFSRLVLFDEAGDAVWTMPAAMLDTDHAIYEQIPARNGDVLLNLADRVARIDPDGDVVFVSDPVAEHVLQTVAELDDGRLVLLFERYSTYDASLVILGPSGSVLDTIPLPPAAPGLEQYQQIAVHATAGGAALIQDPDDINGWVGLDRNGHVAWQDSGFQPPLVDCGDGFVCGSNFEGVWEIDPVTGRPRWSWSTGGSLPTETEAFRFRDGGVLLAYGSLCYDYSCEEPLAASLLPAGGGSSVPIQQRGRLLGVSAAGELLYAEQGVLRIRTAQAPTEGYGYELPGHLVYRHGTYQKAFPLPALLHEDRSATLLTTTCAYLPTQSCVDGLRVNRLTPDGLRWSTPLHVSGEVPLLRSLQLIEGSEGSTFVLLVYSDWPGGVVPGFAVLVRLSAAGDVEWRREWSHFASSGEVSLFDVKAKNALAMVWRRSDTGSLFASSVDAETGAVRAEHELGCPDISCFVWTYHVSPGGTLVAAGATTGKMHVMGRHDLFDEPAGAALDVSGISGAWYAPRSNGQGFSIRRYPGLRTVFMPWFTFDDVQQNETHAQRWYALQGDYVDGATSMTLAIVERHDGRFATEPAGPNEFVGEATLTLQSCDRALLDYRFDAGENDGKAGVIALQPILPRAQPCTDGDGDTHPAQANYDSDMTGSWFDPATSGQGLEIDRIAPSGNDPGLLFAAWFTFAPEDVGSGDNDQRWLTLQGQTPGENGSVRTTIIQTVGGRFDAEPTNNMFAIGQAELVSQGCDRMTLRYRFDDSTDAGEFRARSGEIALQRIGACAGP